MTETHLERTALYADHVALGARMVPFAGYEMPVQYEGVMSEHLWTRSRAGLFDVSHMGQAKVSGAGAVDTLNALTPTEFSELGMNRQKYSLLLAEDGGILDDWMVARPDEEGFFLVVNAGRKAHDFEVIQSALRGDTSFEIYGDRSLLALQGPEAKTVMADFCPQACELFFMQSSIFRVGGAKLIISRSGYTGEDGFEISVPSQRVSEVFQSLLAHEAVKPIGLGARDSLRLEAGMPLYGHDMDETYDLVEAGLEFGLSKSRLLRGDMRGHDRVSKAMQGDMTRVRVGLKSCEGPPAREGTPILSDDLGVVGMVTSGVPSPTLKMGIAMGYVPLSYRQSGTPMYFEIRGKRYRCEVTALPFVKPKYHRPSKA